MSKILYVSTDVETDGPIPGPHSMLSLGAVAFDEGGNEVGDFLANLKELPGAAPDPATAAWWQTQPGAWAAIRVDPRPPAEVMERFAEWVASFNGTSPQFVAYPAGFDFTFVYWYLMRFNGVSPFSFSAIDIKTYAMALLKDPSYRMSAKKHWPKRWRQPFGSHTHVPVDDAREQGRSFVTMLRENLGKRS